MNFEDMEKKMDGMGNKEIKAISNFLTNLLEATALDMLKRNPDSVEAQKRYLASRLANVETLEISELILECPDEEFKKHKQNLELAIETLSKEKEALEKVRGEEE